jgi:hypothetical protein
MVELVNKNAPFSGERRTVVEEKISLHVSRRVARPACVADVVISDPNFSPLWTSGEVVMAAKQFKVICETLLPSCLTYRPPKEICRALSNCEIQSFYERRLHFRWVLSLTWRLAIAT